MYSDNLRTRNGSDDDPSTTIVFPLEIEKWILMEEEAINVLNKVFEIPVATTVRSILDIYKEKDKDNPEASEMLDINTFTLGTLEYFNDMLSPKLLYKTERMQNLETRLLFPGRKACDIYGAFHLVRLMVHLKDHLKVSSMTDEERGPALRRYNHFMQYLDKNRNEMFGTATFITCPHKCNFENI